MIAFAKKKIIIIIGWANTKLPWSDSGKVRGGSRPESQSSATPSVVFRIKEMVWKKWPEKQTNIPDKMTYFRGFISVNTTTCSSSDGSRKR